MKDLTKQNLKDIKDKIQDTNDIIDTLLNDVSLESAEGELGQAISSAQCDLENAINIIRESLQ